MSFDEPNFEDGGDAPLPEESNNNRTFMIAVGILGGIILLSVACLGIFALINLRGRATAAQEQALVNASTATAAAFIDQALTATFQAQVILPTTTSTPVPTSVVNVSTATVATTPEPPKPAGIESTSIANTATIGAAYTQAAAAQLTVVVTTTALPTTGFADEVGLPGLIVMALAFVIVILLARRLRSSPTMNR
jgi:hypothetical protein